MFKKKRWNSNLEQAQPEICKRTPCKRKENKQVKTQKEGESFILTNLDQKTNCHKLASRSKVSNLPMICYNLKTCPPVQSQLCSLKGRIICRTTTQHQ